MGCGQFRLPQSNNNNNNNSNNTTTNNNDKHTTSQDVEVKLHSSPAVNTCETVMTTIAELIGTLKTIEYTELTVLCT